MGGEAVGAIKAQREPSYSQVSLVADSGQLNKTVRSRLESYASVEYTCAGGAGAAIRVQVAPWNSQVAIAGSPLVPVAPPNNSCARGR